MANLLDKVGDLFRGQTELGNLVDEAVDVTGSQRRELINDQVHVRSFMDRYNRFKSYDHRQRALDPTYGPHAMGQDVAYLQENAVKLAMLNPYARAAAKVLVNYTVLSGVNIIIKSAKKSLQKKVSTTINKYLYETVDCDAARHGNFVALETLVAGHYFRAGEVLVRRRWRDFSDGLTLPVTFEVIDPSQFYDGGQPGGVKEGNNYAAGIEFSPLGHPEAYWLYKGNPRNTLYDRTPVRVPVRDEKGRTQIVHLFEKIFPGQIRGIPAAVLAMGTILESQDLRYSVLRRLRMEAKIGLVLKEDFNAKENPEVPGMSMKKPGGAEETIDSQIVTDFVEHKVLQDNMVFPLPPGWDIDHIMIQSGSNYSEFMKDLHRTIAVAYRVPYAALTADIEGVSFSGGKLGTLDFKTERGRDQSFFINNLHQFVFNSCVEAGRLAGLWFDSDITASFKYDAFPSSEPEKEEKVHALQLEKGLTSRRRACAARGEDFFEIVDEIAEEDEYLRSKGLDYLTHDKIMAKAAQKADAAQTDPNATDAKTPAKKKVATA